MSKKEEPLRYRHSDDVSWRRVGEDIVILDLQTSAYFTLNLTAAFVWERLGAGASADEISAALAREFGAKAADAQRSVKVLIQRLLEAKALVERKGGAAPNPAKDKAPRGAGSKSYVAPAMTVLGLLQKATAEAQGSTFEVSTTCACDTAVDCTSNCSACTIPC